MAANEIKAAVLAAVVAMVIAAAEAQIIEPLDLRSNARSISNFFRRLIL